MGRLDRKLRRSLQRQNRTAAASPDGRPSMSELLVEIADPFIRTLRLPDHQDEFRFALDLASAIWNLSKLPDPAERQRLLDAILHPAGGPLPPDGADAINAVYRLSRERYPREKRVIMGIHVYPTGGGRHHIDVASL